MIIQEAQVADAGSLLIKDYCEYPLDSSYKSECSTLVKKSNASTNKNNIVEKYTCIEDLKSKKYYEDELTYSGVECNGVVVYQYDEDNGKYISKNTYISCGDSYVSEGIEKGQIDLNNYPGCND